MPDITEGRVQPDGSVALTGRQGGLDNAVLTSRQTFVESVSAINIGVGAGLFVGSEATGDVLLPFRTLQAGDGIALIDSDDTLIVRALRRQKQSYVELEDTNGTITPHGLLTGYDGVFSQTPMLTSADAGRVLVHVNGDYFWRVSRAGTVRRLVLVGDDDLLVDGAPISDYGGFVVGLDEKVVPGTYVAASFERQATGFVTGLTSNVVGEKNAARNRGSGIPLYSAKSNTSLLFRSIARPTDPISASLSGQNIIVALPEIMEAGTYSVASLLVEPSGLLDRVSIAHLTGSAGITLLEGDGTLFVSGDPASYVFGGGATSVPASVLNMSGALAVATSSSEVLMTIQQPSLIDVQSAGSGVAVFGGLVNAAAQIRTVVGSGNITPIVEPDVIRLDAAAMGLSVYNDGIIAGVSLATELDFTGNAVVTPAARVEVRGVNLVADGRSIGSGAAIYRRLDEGLLFFAPLVSGNGISVGTHPSGAVTVRAAGLSVGTFSTIGTLALSGIVSASLAAAGVVVVDGAASSPPFGAMVNYPGAGGLITVTTGDVLVRHLTGSYVAITEQAASVQIALGEIVGTLGSDVIYDAPNDQYTIQSELPPTIRTLDGAGSFGLGVTSATANYDLVESGGTYAFRRWTGGQGITIAMSGATLSPSVVSEITVDGAGIRSLVSVPTIGASGNHTYLSLTVNEVGHVEALRSSSRAIVVSPLGDGDDIRSVATTGAIPLNGTFGIRRLNARETVSSTAASPGNLDIRVTYDATLVSVGMATIIGTPMVNTPVQTISVNGRGLTTAVTSRPTGTWTEPVLSMQMVVRTANQINTSVAALPPGFMASFQREDTNAADGGRFGTRFDSIAVTGLTRLPAAVFSAETRVVNGEQVTSFRASTRIMTTGTSGTQSVPALSSPAGLAAYGLEGTTFYAYLGGAPALTQGTAPFNVMMMQGPMPLLSERQAFVVNTNAELLAATGAGVVPASQEEIFTSWARFSGADYYPPGTPPAGEATSWAYNTAGARVESTINSSAPIGFVSNEALTDYVHEATIGSTHQDDDMIGLVVAFLRVDNVNRALIVTRTQEGGFGPRYGLVEHASGAQVAVLVNQSSAITNSFLNSDWSNTSGGWVAAGSSRLRVERAGRVITVTSSQNNSTTLDPSTTFTYTIPLGSVFDVPAPYGYVAWSQLNSSFSDISIDGGIRQNVVYDHSVMPPRIHVYNGSAWVVDTTPGRSIWTDLGFPRLVTNPSTNKTYYLDGYPNPQSIIVL